MRYDVVSDTHGFLSDELLRSLEGADVIIHAGDICSTHDLRRLERIAPVKLCLGNNDYGYDFGPFVMRTCRFFSDELRWQVNHYRERLDLDVCDVAVCGHTHRPLIETDRRTGVLVMNPGSPTYPRAVGPSMGRIVVKDRRIVSADIVRLG